MSTLDPNKYISHAMATDYLTENDIEFSLDEKRPQLVKRAVEHWNEHHKGRDSSESGLRGPLSSEENDAVHVVKYSGVMRGDIFSVRVKGDAIAFLAPKEHQELFLEAIKRIVTQVQQSG